jgi:mediator of RNA polymerase II transcription subunit 6
MSHRATKAATRYWLLPTVYCFTALFSAPTRNTTNTDTANNLTMELDEVEWRSPEWINVHGLRTDNVLEYFSQSPFFDRQCNNALLKMQRQYTQQPQPQQPQQPVFIPTVDAELTQLRGREYVVAHTREPDLWVIHQRQRHGPGDTQGAVTVERVFFVVGASVYMAPQTRRVAQQGALAVAQALGAALAKMDALCE